MKKKLSKTEIRTDLAALSVPGKAPGSKLATEILKGRRDRLRKQNEKLDFELEIRKQQYGDIAEMRQEVLRCNAVVKHSLYAMGVRISDPLALMDDPVAIRQFLHDELTQAFNNLAYEIRNETAS